MTQPKADPKASPSRPNPYRGGSTPKLSYGDRERVLKAIYEGHPYKTIGLQFGVSPAYISTLARANGYGRYGLKRRPQ